MADLLARAPREPALAELLRHHLACCRRCRQISRAVERQLALAPAATAPSAVQRLSEEARAQRQELMGLPAEARRAHLASYPARFRNPLLVDQLIEQSEALFEIDAEGAFVLADCALEVARRVPAALVGAAWATVGLARANACRLAAVRRLASGDRAPEERFPLELFAHCCSGSPRAEAELLLLAARVSHEQGRLEEAETLLEHAQLLAEEVGASATLAQIRLETSRVLLDADDPERARDAAEEAVEDLSPEHDPALFSEAKTQLARCFERLGRYEAAWLQLEAIEPAASLALGLAQEGNIEQRWLAARLFHHLGDVAAAEQAFREVWGAYLVQGRIAKGCRAGRELIDLLRAQRREHEAWQLSETLLAATQGNEGRPELSFLAELSREAAESLPAGALC